MTGTYNTACSLIESGDFKQAIEILETIIKEDGQHYPALNKLGVAFACQRNHEAAKEYFNKALEVNPGYAPALVNLGNLHMEAGDYMQAIDIYMRAIDGDPEYCYSYYNLAIACRRQGDFSKYIKYIKEYKRFYTKDLKHNKPSLFKALPFRRT